MAKNNSIKTNMGYLGEDYQYLLVKYFIETPQFFVSLVSIIDQNMFTDEHLRRIVGMMKDRQSKNGLCPNYNDIELLIRTTVNDKITVDIMIEKLNSLKNRNFDIDIDLLTSNAEKFFKLICANSPGEDPLDVLQKRFHGTGAFSGIRSFCASHGIEARFDSYS